MTDRVGPHRLFSYAGCTTCRKALAWLSNRGLRPGQEVDVIDITISPPASEELRQSFSQLGRARLFNTSGQSYRRLGAAHFKALTDDQAIAALAADGRLIKRPFLMTAQGVVLTGFKQEEWEALFG